MDQFIVIVLGCIFALRIAFLGLSVKNERSIRANGGTEYGVGISKALSIAHILIYFLALGEAYWRETMMGTVNYIGLALLLFSMGMLYWITQLLSGIWTVKLMVAKNHEYNDHWLFRTVKHPNYFLNIVPELLGVVLLCQAWYTAIVLFPVYAWILYQRIVEENRVLREIIIPNSL